MQLQRDTSSHCSYDQWSFPIELDYFCEKNIFFFAHVNISCLLFSFFYAYCMEKIKLLRILLLFVWNLRNKGFKGSPKLLI